MEITIKTIEKIAMMAEIEAICAKEKSEDPMDEKSGEAEGYKIIIDCCQQTRADSDWETAETEEELTNSEELTMLIEDVEWAIKTVKQEKENNAIDEYQEKWYSKCIITLVEMLEKIKTMEEYEWQKERK